MGPRPLLLGDCQSVEEWEEGEEGEKRGREEGGEREGEGCEGGGAGGGNNVLSSNDHSKSLGNICHELQVAT